MHCLLSQLLTLYALQELGGIGQVLTIDHTIIDCNNQSALALAQANQQAFHPHTKHINSQMITDVLTKALPRPNDFSVSPRHFLQ
jgi:hypothetical protein